MTIWGWVGRRGGGPVEFADIVDPMHNGTLLSTYSSRSVWWWWWIRSKERLGNVLKLNPIGLSVESSVGDRESRNLWPVTSLCELRCRIHPCKVRAPLHQHT